MQVVAANARMPCRRHLIVQHRKRMRHMLISYLQVDAHDWCTKQRGWLLDELQLTARVCSSSGWRASSIDGRSTRRDGLTKSRCMPERKTMVLMRVMGMLEQK